MNELGKLKTVGWDGDSREIIQLWMPCGCRWTKDRTHLLTSCTDHLTTFSEGAKSNNFNDF